MPEWKRRKSRGKCLVWRGISTCKTSAEVACGKGFCRQHGDGAKAFTPMGTWPLHASSAQGDVMPSHRRGAVLGVTSRFGQPPTVRGPLVLLRSRSSQLQVREQTQ